MRKYTLFFLTLALTVLSPVSRAAITPMFTDIKLSSQQVVERQAMGTPAAADTNSLLSASAGNTSAAAASVSTFLAQPDVPRNLALLPGGSTAHLNACTVTVSGLNFYYKPISEDFVFASAASTATVGLKAFRSVSAVSFPAGCEASPYDVTWSLGKGEKLGLKYCLANAGEWLQSSVAGVHESTLATVVTHATAVENNTADFNGTMNGSNAFVGQFFQNFLCKP